MKGNPSPRCLACATDGALSMMGRYRGFNAFLKSENPNVIICRCVIHRQHLVAKNINGRLNQSLRTVIKAVNKTKTRALNTCLFKQLFNENDEAFERFLLHTEVQWLSKRNCLARFNLLCDTVVNFCKVAILVSLKKPCSSEMILHTYRTYSPNLVN